MWARRRGARGGSYIETRPDARCMSAGSHGALEGALANCLANCLAGPLAVAGERGSRRPGVAVGRSLTIEAVGGEAGG